MKWTIKPHETIEIGKAVSEALYESLKDSSKAEPQLVANLVWHLVEKTNNLSFSGGFSMKSGGVFVHQQPFVKCDSFPDKKPASVEIGDILLLRTGIKSGKVIDRRAMLLQAKKCDRFPTTPDNRNQHHLYAQWPTFEYAKSTKKLNGKKRYVKGLDLHNAAKYLLIGKNPHCSCCSPCCEMFHCSYPHFHGRCVFTAQPSQPELSHYRCFLNEMVEFILGDAGKEYVSPPPKRTRNWDRVIQDLTTVTSHQTSVYMGRASSKASSTRGQAMCFLTGVFPAKAMLSKIGSSMKYGIDGPPEVPAEYARGGDGDGGISIIEFVVGSEGDNLE